MLVAPNTPKNQSARWWRLSAKGVPTGVVSATRATDRCCFGYGRFCEGLRVVGTPLRVELYVVLKHPERELPERPVTNPVGIDKGMIVIFTERMSRFGLLTARTSPGQRALSRSVEAHKQKEKQAGRRLPYVRVNPSHTSTDCSCCGHRQSMPLSVRVYECEGCGLIMCRDHNAARNICARGFPHREPRDRPGLSADVSRYTNLCCKTGELFGARRQADDTEQYQSTLGYSGI